MPSYVQPSSPCANSTLAVLDSLPGPSLSSRSPSGLFQGARHLGLPLPASGLHLATPGYPGLSVSPPAYTPPQTPLTPSDWPSAGCSSPAQLQTGLPLDFRPYSPIQVETDPP
ncbi:hypothetical protein M404DRAFT_23691 [Pisolithus tinctorius Marx 270]|uniref:Uncharacterized protein n=1 Tax=Pisolithus tinctorius Marx 270 TaxID=870435 RepID=A0A0C3KC77_PISTI|nr:hypothetical protein M404DRAFT_23691 [Pisolithus tinctorius Marx 270]